MQEHMRSVCTVGIKLADMRKWNLHMYIKYDFGVHFLHITEATQNSLCQ